MSTLLLTLPLRRRRDVVLAWQRARQIAGLLEFAPADQACIASAVFEMSDQARRRRGQWTLHFELDRDTLQVFSVGHPHCLPLASRRIGGPAGGRGLGPYGETSTELRFEKPLPNAGLSLDRADLPWLVGQLAHLTPLNLLGEIRRQNRELLSALRGAQPHLPVQWPEEREWKRPPAA